MDRAGSPRLYARSTPYGSRAYIGRAIQAVGPAGELLNCEFGAVLRKEGAGSGQSCGLATRLEASRQGLLGLREALTAARAQPQFTSQIAQAIGSSFYGAADMSVGDGFADANDHVAI